jgi:hypothetical protein
MKNKYAELLSQVNNDQRSATDSILICDGLNTFLRAFTMINYINPEGHHIGGLIGFLKSVGYAIKLIDPTKVVIVFDGVCDSELVDERVCVALLDPVRVIDGVIVGVLVNGPVTVDDADGVAEAFDVEALPTFLFLNNGIVVTKFSGGNSEILKEECEKLCTK